MPGIILLLLTIHEAQWTAGVEEALHWMHGMRSMGPITAHFGCWNRASVVRLQPAKTVLFHVTALLPVEPSSFAEAFNHLDIVKQLNSVEQRYSFVQLRNLLIGIMRSEALWILWCPCAALGHTGLTALALILTWKPTNKGSLRSRLISQQEVFLKHDGWLFFTNRTAV